MTPLPKRKLSTRRQGHRRTAINLSIAQVSKCPNCGELIRPHIICSHCGYYGGQQVLTIKAKEEKSENRK